MIILSGIIYFVIVFFNVNGMEVSQAGHLCMEDGSAVAIGSDSDIFNI